MIVNLNKEPVEIEVPEGASVADVMERVKEQHFSAREFITSFSLNGEMLEGDHQENGLRMKAADVESLEVTTDDIRNLSIRTLEKMDELVDGLMTTLEESADKFRVEDEKVANQHFITSVEALQTFVEVIVKIKSLNSLDYGELMHDGRPVSEREEKLLDIFNSLLQTQRSKDWVSLADVLEYELVDLLKDWKAIFPMLRQEIERMDN